MKAGRGDVRDHHRLAVAAQRVLEQSRQLAVAKIHVPRIFTCGKDRERNIYFAAAWQGNKDTYVTLLDLPHKQNIQSSFQRAHQPRRTSWFRSILVGRTERVDDVSEREQRAVDVRALYHAFAAVVRGRGALRTGQVDEEEFSHALLLHDVAQPVTLLHRHLPGKSKNRS